MFLNVPSGLRPELEDTPTSWSLLDLSFFGIWYLTALVHKHQTVASLKVSAIIAITLKNKQTRCKHPIGCDSASVALHCSVAQPFCRMPLHIAAASPVPMQASH